MNEKGKWYLSRFDDELEQIKIKNSINQRKRQHASREDIINMTKKAEREEYSTCGIELPNLLDAQQLNVLKDWNGEMRFMQNFKLRRFTPNFLNASDEDALLYTEKYNRCLDMQKENSDLEMNIQHIEETPINNSEDQSNNECSEESDEEMLDDFCDSE